jgi:hypothetical protein
MQGISGESGVYLKLPLALLEDLNARREQSAPRHDVPSAAHWEIKAGNRLRDNVLVARLET